MDIIVTKIALIGNGDGYKLDVSKIALIGNGD